MVLDYIKENLTKKNIVNAFKKYWWVFAIVLLIKFMAPGFVDETITTEPQSIALITSALGTGGVTIASALVLLIIGLFFINPVIGVIALVAVFLLIGIPFIGLTIAILQNFKLVVVVIGLAFAVRLFTRVRK